MLTIKHRSPVVQLIAAGTAVAAVAVTSAAARTVEPATDAHLAYEDAFLDIAFRIGGVIEVGVGEARSMKRAVGAVDRGDLRGDRLREEAATWVRTIDDIEGDLRSLPVPRNLGGAQARFLAALEGYAELAVTLGGIAAVSHSDEIDALLDEAVAIGQEADRRFDQAAAILQRHRQTLGLGTNPNLPDPRAELPPGVTVVNPGETEVEDR